MLRLVRRALATLAQRFGHVPRGTQVDPSLFPEDEFPVQCLRCGYELRGLRDSRCPECGDKFARGELLVELYVRCRRPQTDKYRRVARLLTILSIVIVGIQQLALWSLWLGLKLAPETSMAALCRHDFRPWISVALLLAIAGTLAGFVAMMLWLAIVPPLKKRRAVRQAAEKGVRNL